jgi:DNA-binding SARP family transcriptional activator
METSARLAEEGLALVPADARATRLRLEGNIAITSVWVTEGLDAVARACKRIAAEAIAAGWEHSAAIAFHNLGTIQRHIGSMEHSISNLERAARYWGNYPSNPYADNAELALALLTVGNVKAAEQAAVRGVAATQAWQRPQAEARYGLAIVRMHQGRFEEAKAILEDLLVSPVLGSVAEMGAVALLEVLHLMNAPHADWEEPSRLLATVHRDPRFAPMAAAGNAFRKHYSTRCRGACLRAVAAVREWEPKGAVFTAIISNVKTAPLGIAHNLPNAISDAVTALQRADDNNLLPHLRVWLRPYIPHIGSLIRHPGAVALLVRFLQLDAEGWRAPITEILPTLGVQERSQLLTALIPVANKETYSALAEIPGGDVAAVRKVMIRRQAPRLLIRTFGGLTVERLGSRQPPRSIDKRRLRSLLALIVAQRGQPLTRDVAFDTLWPDAAPAAAVNNLNQAMFQLRRAIDETYKEGESPQYLLATAETVQLDSDLVTTDLREFRSISTDLRDAASGPTYEKLASAAVDLIRGAFLEDLRYEDWVASVEAPIHAEIRQLLLPIAQGTVASPDLAIQAAAALIKLDEFDEAAVAAMARQLSETGRRAAAREVIVRFARHLRDELDEPLSADLAALIGGLPPIAPAASSSI